MIHSKLPNVGTTIFSVMSNVAKENNAINLSQGFPDFPISPKLLSLVTDAMQQGYNQYAPMIGLHLLREQLTKKIHALYHQAMDADTEITITPGGTYAIYTALTTLLNEGDEAIVLEPAYDSYIPGIETNKAKAICIPLQYPNFSIDWQRVKDAITPKTKVIILNTPHNPSGYVCTEQDMKMLEEIVTQHDLYVISDEVYEHITFDGRKHLSVLQYPAIYARSFVVFSFGKVLHTTGWKLGYCVAPPALSVEFRKIHQFLCFTCNTPMQYAIAYYIEDEKVYTDLPLFFERKRDYFLSQLANLPFTIYKKAQGSYFQLAGYENISTLPDKEFALMLARDYGVATIPMSAFNSNGKDDKLIRFCFAKEDTTLQQACARMQKLRP